MERTYKPPKDVKMTNFGGPSSATLTPGINVNGDGNERDAWNVIPDLYSWPEKNRLGGYQNYSQVVQAWGRDQTPMSKSLQKFNFVLRGILSRPEDYGVAEADIDDSNLMIYGIEKKFIYGGPSVISIGSKFTDEEYNYALRTGFIVAKSKRGNRIKKKYLKIKNLHLDNAEDEISVDENYNEIIDMSGNNLLNLVSKHAGKTSIAKKAAQVGDQFLQGITATGRNQLGKSQQF